MTEQRDLYPASRPKPGIPSLRVPEELGKNKKWLHQPEVTSLPIETPEELLAGSDERTDDKDTA